MSRKKTVLLLAFALLTALTLGCGLLDSLKKKAVDEGAQLVEQGKATVQAAVTEAAPDKTPDTEPLSETAEPTEAPTEPASKPTGDGIDLAALSSMDSLNSFRMVASINWTRVMTDGTSESGSMRMLTERDRAAQASRLSIEGALPDAVPSLVGEGKTMELIQIGTSMYVNTGDGEWMAMQMGADQVEDQFSWDADPRDFARGQGSYEGIETVNGYEAKRYHYSEGAVDDLGFGRMDESSADVWVAEIGTGDAAVTVVVKAQTTFAGKDLAGVEWSGEMTVDVTDVNAPITIEAPEGVEPPGMPEDVPLMEGAENVQSVMGINTFEVEATLDEVMAFYDDEMAANGWSLDDDSVPGMRTYTKDARSAMLMAEETEAGASVTIMISEN